MVPPVQSQIFRFCFLILGGNVIKIPLLYGSESFNFCFNMGLIYSFLCIIIALVSNSIPLLLNVLT
jgi:hypothetical protein